MSDCIFCKIIEKSIPAKIAFEDDEILAFHDINPQAPVHVLIIPKKHIAKIGEIELTDAELIGKLIFRAKKLAEELNISESGYRLVFNNGQDGGQDVYHIHLHMLGGKAFGWPPG